MSSPAEYRRQRTLFLSVSWGLSVGPFWLDDFGAVVLMIYLCLLTILQNSSDHASSVPLSVHTICVRFRMVCSLSGM